MFSFTGIFPDYVYLSSANDGFTRRCRPSRDNAENGDKKIMGIPPIFVAKMMHFMI